ncbi:MAG: 30S ribosomal protein S15 [Phycisphaerales bacterium]
MSISAERRTELVAEYRTHDKDTGSPEVQMAILTDEIRELTEHLKEHKHDFSSRRGLLAKVSRRNRLSRYLRETNRERYQTVISRLGLRK